MILPKQPGVLIPNSRVSLKRFMSRTTLKLTFCFYLFLGFTLPTKGQAGEYYIYQDPNGKLVISNQQPPPGSKVIKQQTLPEEADSTVQQPEEHNGAELNGPAEGSPKPSKNK